MLDDGEYRGIYPGGSTGHQGGASAESERDRAKRVPTILAIVRNMGALGATSREIEMATGWSHGTVSGALTNLHGDGTITRLTAKRGRGKVYVVVDQVNGREFEDKGSVCKCGPCEKHGAA